MWRSAVLFVVLGSALFALDRLWWGAEPPPPVVVPAARVEAVRVELARVLGRAPSEAELSRALEPEVDDALLYREALARGYERGDPVVYRRLVQNLRFAGAASERDDASLYREALDLGMHRSDVVVRRRLVQRMRFELEAAAGDADPDEAALRAHYAERRDAYRSEARVRFTQLYFDAAHDERARRRLEELAGSGEDSERAHRHGDPFLYPPDQPPQTRAELADRFGDAFADGVFALEPEAWQGPVPSAYGAHLVRVHEHTPARALDFEEVRERVRYEVLAERRRDALERELARMRERATVRIEGVGG